MTFDPHHPIPLGRRVALREATDWVPLKGIQRKVSEAFRLSRDAAGLLIAMGMQEGRIAHRVEGAQDWVVTPRAAALVRQSGFSYETMIHWETGCIDIPGAGLQAAQIYWPDVEQAARSPEHGRIVEIETAQTVLARTTPPRTGPRPLISAGVKEEMLAALQAGMTREELRAIPKKELPHRFGGGETTCHRVRQTILIGPG